VQSLARQPEVALWHVTVTYAGAPVDAAEVRRGLERLTQQSPFLASARYASDRVEVRYWEEAENIDDAAAMALRLWHEHRACAGLPDWAVVGLEVLDRKTVRQRASRGQVQAAFILGEVRPL
jgi:hypothetical protein